MYSKRVWKTKTSAELISTKKAKGLIRTGHLTTNVMKEILRFVAVIV